FQTYLHGNVILQDVIDHGFLSSTPLPGSAGSEIVDFSSSNFNASISDNRGTTFQSVSLSAVGSMSVTFVSAVKETRTFNTELLQLDMTGGGPTAGFSIRESPALKSLGQITVTGTGPYQIDSFFDVFTEFSSDGGRSWFPSDGGSARLTLAEGDPSWIGDFN